MIMSLWSLDYHLVYDVCRSLDVAGKADLFVLRGIGLAQQLKQFYLCPDGHVQC